MSSGKNLRVLRGLLGAGIDPITARKLAERAAKKHKGGNTHCLEIPTPAAPKNILHIPTKPIRQPIYRDYKLKLPLYSDSKIDIYTNGLKQISAIGVNRNGKRYYVDRKAEKILIIDHPNHPSREPLFPEIDEFSIIMKSELKDPTAQKVVNDILQKLNYSTITF